MAVRPSKHSSFRVWSFGPSRNDEQGGHKKACRHLRRQALFRHAGSSAAVTQDATLTKMFGITRRSNAGGDYEMTSAVTRPTPAPVRPTARAAPVDRSSTRPRMNGPRSLTVTTTLRPPWVTRSLVPNGRVRWAAVIALAFMRWPEAVRLPDSLP